MKLPTKVQCIIYKEVNRKHEFLILKRLDSKGGFWQPITGSVEESDKDIESASFREIFEEIKVKKSDILKKHSNIHSFQFKNDKNTTITEYVFAFEVKSNVKINIDSNIYPEHSEYEWALFEKAINTIEWENNKIALSKVNDMLTKNKKMDHNRIKELEENYDFGTYPKRDITIVSGKAALLYDEKGNEYIDCTSGVGVANIGHCHPKLAKTLEEQSKKLITCYSIFHNDKRAELLQKIVQIAPSPIAKAFLCNSGTESVEAAIKFARSTTGKQTIIALNQCFHGKTIGSLALTHNKKYQAPFAPIMPAVIHIPKNDIEKLKEAIQENKIKQDDQNHNIAAVIIELIQGERGVRPLDKEYVTKLRQITKENNILLIIDEVQTGFGRTGKMFATNHYNVEPDIICTAKAIAGGVPMGATLTTKEITAPTKSHTSTFGGNALACAAALTTIEILEDNNSELINNSKEIGNYIIKQINDLNLPKVREVRGMGLMIGIGLKVRAGEYVHKLMTEHKILALLAGPLTSRLLPPLCITKEQADQVITTLKEVLN